MKIAHLLLLLGSLCLNAHAADYPTNTPFADRYPPDTITNAQRAREVIQAYEHEKNLWDDWYEAEKKACYRNFFVTYCLDSVREERYTHIQEARQVWLVARDFLRKERSDEAVKTRKENEAKQAAKNERIEAEAAERAKAKKKQPVKTTPSSRKPAEARPDRTLSAEEEKANEEAFEQKQIKHQERVAEQEGKAPTPPSETEQERIDERAKRRAEAEKRKIENIRKREAKAAEYERQLKLREEQKAQGLVNQLNP